MTPDQATVAEYLVEVDRDSGTLDFLMRERNVVLSTPIADVLGSMFDDEFVEATPEGRLLRLTEAGRAELYRLRGWVLDGPPMWQQRKRQGIEATFQSATPTQTTTHVSPGGKYSLEVTEFSNGEARWAYSRGVVRAVDRSGELAVVYRNYPAFPFTWCESHPNGHDYLICGEDYQGQTIIELDTAERVDHLPAAAESGSGFCWARHYLTPDRRMLVVDGCYWACPYELVVFDFTDPMGLPYRELFRWQVDDVEDDGFSDDGEFRWTYQRTARSSDLTILEELTDGEIEELLDENRFYRDELLAEVTYRGRWKPDEEPRFDVLKVEPVSE